MAIQKDILLPPQNQQGQEKIFSLSPLIYIANFGVKSGSFP